MHKGIPGTDFQEAAQYTSPLLCQEVLAIYKRGVHHTSVFQWVLELEESKTLPRDRDEKGRQPR